ncbi:MAG: kinase [Candidatus Jorgensenbacteria bacterium]|nr:kinase [Candidatus Jorgensenbacteria bacterium]
MVITKTPLRVSFFGGGTDYPAWVKEYGGAVLSTSIDKYSHLYVQRLLPFFSYKTKIVWSRIEEVGAINEIAHPSVRETLRFMNLDGGLAITYNGDLPARSGVGSSSSFTVGFLHALYGLKKVTPDKKKLAEEAIHIEQNCIKENVGSQDQIAAAFGGFNKIEFNKDGSFTVMPIQLSKERCENLQKHMMLFFTGFSRNASDVAHEQIKNIPNKIKELHAMHGMVDEAIGILQRNGDWLGDFGRLLNKSWELKRDLSAHISNDAIDNLYKRAMDAGALGGKLLGAGGGGFFLVYARPEKQKKIRAALSELLYVPFAFENEGSKIIYQAH